MLKSLLVQLWNDESGVIATEYLMLSSIVAVGSAAGLAAMRDSVAEEYKEFGNEMREARQSFTKPTHRNATGAVPGSVAATPGAAIPPGYAVPPGYTLVPAAGNAPVQAPVYTPTFSMP
jgi:Flp pilus assembly pilin Flp